MRRPCSFARYGHLASTVRWLSMLSLVLGLLMTSKVQAQTSVAEALALNGEQATDDAWLTTLPVVSRPGLLLALEFRGAVSLAGDMFGYQEASLLEPGVIPMGSRLRVGWRLGDSVVSAAFRAGNWMVIHSELNQEDTLSLSFGGELAFRYGVGTHLPVSLYAEVAATLDVQTVAASFVGRERGEVARRVTGVLLPGAAARLGLHFRFGGGWFMQLSGDVEVAVSEVSGDVVNPIVGMPLSVGGSLNLGVSL